MIAKLHLLARHLWQHIAGIRTKIVVLSSFLLLLPYLGYQYVWEMENVLRQGQEQTLMGTARAFAMGMNDRPSLFSYRDIPSQLDPGKDLHAFRLNHPITLDGDLGDWQRDRHHQRHYQRDGLIFNQGPYHSNQLALSVLTGSNGDAVYFGITVTDASPTPAQRTGDITSQDHMILALTSPQGAFYRVALSQDSHSNNAHIRHLTSGLPTLADETSTEGPAQPLPIAAKWQPTDKGYSIEVKLPANWVGQQLALAYYDRGNGFERPLNAIIGSASTRAPTSLGSFMMPSAAIQSLIERMNNDASRVWVVDKHSRVLAKDGDIQTSNGVWQPQSPSDQSEGLIPWITDTLLRPWYDRLLVTPPDHFVDAMQQASIYQGVQAQQALQGRPYAGWRSSDDNQAMILSAAYPIWLDDRVAGAVIVEETTNGIRSLRNEALETLFSVMLAVICTGVLLLLLFGSHIAKRLRRLQHEADHAIDSQGRVTGHITTTHSHDEIGRLSRTMADMVSRIAGYNHYLEAMSSRLSHELRTPIAVVRSSLENMAYTQENPDQLTYINRAQDGVHRLAGILSTLTEATRLEQSFDNADKEMVDLNALLEGCAQGYQFAYPDKAFTLSLPHHTVNVLGVPDYLAQLLDKLIANAVEFDNGAAPIALSLSQNAHQVAMTVSNSGPLLPEHMREQLFNSMVSVRPEGHGADKPHLGLGLYIARLIADFHQADLVADNRPQQDGVTLSLIWPNTQLMTH
ncbi:proteobacterial dedicated sortase system histidine kinase [Salinivibrio sp. IB868]|uniref:proteobacterial dedicated sortase system histidine kinase n=1 Tax=unclassified Salinivibrio TaxID=2636825 RepID=UPI000986C4B6|nr:MULTISPECIES: proteobacterial dedicated sortase system histidine kinase [unclassified Salinivibrio]OOE65085.1 proteobacterial dedicated sortase system histidine kinase [Salinivibrio sp. IB868]OOE75109.1 proteobacterial dedicated sortase system histidine kinase [Salinivibrio sp. IB870]